MENKKLIDELIEAFNLQLREDMRLDCYFIRLNCNGRFPREDFHRFPIETLRTSLLYLRERIEEQTEKDLHVLELIEKKYKEASK